jgi:CspA family cold shock protein
MSAGTIKKLVMEKGFGFITPDDKSELAPGKEELFFHATMMANNGSIDSLREGQRVSYVVGNGAKGPQADQVQGE